MKTIVPHKKILLLLGTALCLFQGFSAMGQELDSRFRVPTPYSAPYIEDMIETRDRKVLMGGDLYFANGKETNSLVKLSARGTIDGTFRTDYDGYAEQIFEMKNGQLLVVDDDGYVAHLSKSGLTLDWPDEFEGWVETMVVLPDGGILVAGDGWIGKYTSDFMEDPSFGDEGWIEVDGWISQMSVRDGKIYVAGDFESLNDTEIYDMARLNLDGSIDDTFSIGGGVSGDNGVYSFTFMADGSILLGNNYYGTVNGYGYNGRMPWLSSTGSPMLFNNWYFYDLSDVVVQKNRVVVADTDGEYVVAFLLNGEWDSSFAYNEYDWDGEDVQLLGVSSGDLLIANGFETPVSNGLEKRTKSGAKVPSFNPDISSYGNITEITQAGSHFFISGYFNKLDKNQALNLARVRSSGAFDRAFKMTNYYGDIWNIQGFNDGTVLAQTDYGIRRFSGNGSEALFSLDTSWPLNSEWDILKTKILPDNDIMFLTDYGVVRRNIDGSADNSFAPAVFNNYDSYWKDFAFQSDGKVIVAGAFSAINSISVPRIARLNTDGSIDESFDAGTGPNGYVREVAVNAQDEVMVKGGFYYWNGTYVSYWNEAGVVILDKDAELQTDFTDELLYWGWYSPNWNTPRAIGLRDGFIFNSNYGLLFTTAEGDWDYIYNLLSDDDMYVYPSNFYAPDAENLYVTGWIWDGARWRRVARFEFPEFVPEVEEEAPMAEAARMGVYPNPTKDFVGVDVTTSPVKISVFSSEGTLKVSKIVTSSDQRIDVSSLPKGRYVVKIIRDGKVMTQHLIKD